MSLVYEPFQTRVIMTFKDDSTFELNNINELLESYKLFDETAKEIKKPIGVVSANTLDLVLDNIDGLFTISNIDSPLYGKMGRDVKIEISFTTDNITYIPRGTFYVTKWDNKSILIMT